MVDSVLYHAGFLLAFIDTGIVSGVAFIKEWVERVKGVGGGNSFTDSKETLRSRQTVTQHTPSKTQYESQNTLVTRYG